MPNNKRSVMLSDDILIDVFKFSDRFDIGERFEFVNANWSKCIARVEAAHLPLFKFHKIWICPLFCALHYSMRPTEDTILKEIFEDCSEQCRDQFMPLISDDWPAQRIPLCIYLERNRSAARQKRTQLKKITLNHNNWRVERNENGHFFMHFQQLCFEEAYLDVYNDRALTLFLLDCPIFQLLTGHFSIRTVTESLPFQRVVEFCKTKVQLTGWPMGKDRSRVQKQQLMRMVEEGQGKMENLPSASEMQNPIFTFALTGGANCSELTLESNEFAMLFDLIEEYKYAPDLSQAIASVRLAVPPYNWHQRDFVEDTICQMFDTSESISATLHRFSYFDALSAFAKFICNVHFHEEDPDKIKYYEFCAPNNQQLEIEQEEGKEIDVKHLY